MIKAGIVGATGYAGQELTQLLYRHPEVKIIYLSSNSYAGQKFSDVYPHYKGFIDFTLIKPSEAMDRMSELDIIFTALPHGTSFDYAAKALEAGIKIVDLGADFRLDDIDIFEKWYKTEHLAKNLIDKAVYGLPELWKEDIKKSQLIANPGCYTTASILALSPALKHKLIDPSSIIVDAKSGVTGAGRKPNISLMLAECGESVKAYGIASHRHTPEIEQELSKVFGDKLNLTFTPHLMPMQKGILATCYATLNTSVEEADIYNYYKTFYSDAPFVRIREGLLETRFVKDTNYCDISIKVDNRNKRLVVTSAIDNLIKGASGQAVQNMNLIFGLDEKEGLY